MKKNVFFTFCLACIPGAGAMYLGYMKRGLSQMLLFCAVCGVAAAFYLEMILFLLPVIFAFCFFDTWRLRNQTPEQAEQNPDAYLIDLATLGGDDWKLLVAKRHNLIGWACIAVAALMLYNNIFRRLLWQFDFIPGFVHFALDSVPSLMIIVGLVLLGMYLLRGPRAAAPAAIPQEEYVAYTGAQEGKQHE